MSIKNFHQIEELFRSKGVKKIYCKALAKKQDNEKNQIYIASNNSIANCFPSTTKFRSQSESTKKAKSREGEPIIELLLNFYWLDSNGQCYSAPEAKIINYFQYPEARLSAFLKGCKRPPDALRRRNQANYGKRIMFLGSNSTGETFGLVTTEKDDPVTLRMPGLSASFISKTLLEHSIGGKTGKTAKTPKDNLLNELQSISGYWHPSVSLKSAYEKPIPFKGTQGAGYTLEALLKIPRNSKKAPDKHGFEIKSFKTGGKISLMTPTADKGEEGKLTFRKFMEEFGWKGKEDPNRTVFNGNYKYMTPMLIASGRTLSLETKGFNMSHDLLTTNSVDPLVGLFDQKNKLLVSGWSFDKLLSCWTVKHASACYVEYEKRNYSGAGSGHDAEYRFTGRILLCEGTNIWNYIQAIAAKEVTYDPGHTIYQSGKAKQRPQWRIYINKKFKLRLAKLYDNVEELNF